ncbi:MAG: Gfo/Idh/MocA family oxidoreductase [Bacteroidetes bacterium]|jgi:myo-inositol 2-dehydrogenase / D-chiro-inositol 1-dehydrogenase|nr:Gfo/Idh/MocA family oxidoreductase [Bacteroidota bacterium]MBT3751442.1 Gfo/Idh/MocA family oxidoreductase [Bacteroidota bacterium]MBT4400485.1 Gfo/Idh/MocA family oxidoreductase [Bacteroidota bacterium]MBT4410496.1 Gfo/Idh/MocA family oxidoreductase [Bacteroidota bacterium]MBT5426197.1 Gfo/Idh/MocA family oxidoreductase [Bacteroidota bacterium]
MQRRNFLKSTAAVSTFTIVQPSIAFGSKINSAIKIGIIGCGNRGSSVIASMSRHTNIHIAAMADLFSDKLDIARPRLNKLNTDKGLAKISQSKIYSGKNAYLELINDPDLDAVLISSPAYTHPEFLSEAIKAGKHAYCEKPMAVDAAGCSRIVRLGQEIDGKLSVVIGFQIRHASPYMEMVKRVKRGDIGKVINAQLYYFSSGTPVRPYPQASWDEQRIRNQYKFRALSGGILLDQGIHMLDVCNWTLGAHPIDAIGRGGRNEAPDFGDGWNNFQVIYQYPDDISVSLHSTQFGPHFGDVCARFTGTKGIAEAHYTRGVFITGDNAWDSGMLRDNRKPITPEQRSSGVFPSALHDADANKEKAFINSIESGNFLNETQSGANSTLSAILGREAATKGEQYTWDEMKFENKKIPHDLKNVGW